MAKLTIPPYVIGQSVGHYKIISEPFRKLSRWYYKAECECGTIKEVKYSHLASGLIVSCGCYNSKLTAQRNYKHGYTKRNEIEPLFWRWCTMRQRCEDSNKDNYRCLSPSTNQ
jgi:hypothetical protein